MLYNLLFFIAGIFFYAVIIPIIESLIVLVETKAEVKKYQLSVSIAKYSAEINKIQGEQEEISTNAIGFALPEEEYYEEDEEE